MPLSSRLKHILQLSSVLFKEAQVLKAKGCHVDGKKAHQAACLLDDVGKLLGKDTEHAILKKYGLDT